MSALPGPGFAWIAEMHRGPRPATRAPRRDAVPWSGGDRPDGGGQPRGHGRPAAGRQDGGGRVELLGVGLLALVAIALLVIVRPSALAITRAIQPPRVPKGSPAIAVLSFANKGRRSVGVTVANQPFGDTQVRTIIPRLRRGERGLRTYRLPTRQRGIFDVGPVEVTRRDPFDLMKASLSTVQAAA